MACKILLTATVRWPSVARIAGAFAMAGCQVDALYPRKAPAAVSRYIAGHYAYQPVFPFSSLRRAIAASRPDMVVPCDDRAATHMLRLYDNARTGTAADAPIAALLQRSLGNPSAYATVMSRSGFIAAARAAGVRAPETYPVSTEKELDDCLAAIGLPAVLKSDGSWGGEGIAIVRDKKQAHVAFRRLARPPSRLRSLARAMRRHDAHYLLAAIAPSSQAVSVQRFVVGQPAASAFAAWLGKVAGEVHYDVLLAQGMIGPPNVIKRVDCPEMAEAARRIAKRFLLSGIHGLDFIRDAAGAVHLIEINPRATQGSYLALGGDVPAALAACVAPGEIVARPPIPNDVVAFFPREWERDPQSPYLKTAYHDVPWDDPGVLRACLGMAVQPAARHVLPAQPVARPAAQEQPALSGSRNA